MSLRQKVLAVDRSEWLGKPSWRALFFAVGGVVLGSTVNILWISHFVGPTIVDIIGVLIPGVSVAVAIALFD